MRRQDVATKSCFALCLLALLIPQVGLGGDWTLTSNDDFLPGQVSNLLVSGGSLQLPNESGSMSSWITVTNLSAPAMGHAATVVNRMGYGTNSTASSAWLFVVGGKGQSDPTDEVVRYSWSGCSFSSATTLVDAPLPDPTHEHTLVPLDAGLLVIGGLVSGQPSDQVLHARYTFDAKLHPWRTVSAQLPEPRWRHASVAHGGYVYVIGGSPTTDPDSASATVYYANPTADGDVLNWSTTTPLPEPRADLAAVAVDKYLYVIGGNDSTGAATATVYRSQIASDGSLGAWQAMPSLLAARRGHAAALHHNEIMVVGGRESGIPRRDVFRARIDDVSGSLSSWAAGSNYDFYIADHVLIPCSTGFLALGGEDIYESVLQDTRRTELTATAEYAHLGSYLSPVFELGDEHPISTLDWTYTASSQTVRVRARTAGNEGVWDPWSAYSETGSISLSVSDRFAQFEVSLQSDATSTPLCESASLVVPSVSFVSGTVSSTVDWPSAASPYVVTGTITVTGGGTFTVQPGVEVRFRSGTGIKIQQAWVNVQGLLGSEVLWTSLSDSLGEWGSIYYDSNSDDGVASEWSYAIVEKGGENIWNVGSTLFYLTSTTEPTLSDCVFRKSTGNGIRASSSRPSMVLCTIEDTDTHALYASGGGDTAPNLAYCDLSSANGLPTVYCSGANAILLGTPVVCADTVAVYLESSSAAIRNCHVESGTEYAVRLNGNSLPELSGNTYVSPYSPPLAIEPSTISTTGTLYYDGVGHAVLGDVYVGASSAVELALDPGVTLHFATGARFLAGTNQYLRGSIRAVGTVASPITFTSLSGSVGDWNGIHLGNYNGNSRFERCIFEKAGPTEEGLECSGGSVTLHQTTFRDPGADCLFISGTEATVIDSCAFSGSPGRTILLNSSTVEMTNSDVSSETGIALQNNGASIFDNVTFTSTDSFAVYSTSDSPLFASCSMTGERAAAYLENSSPTIQGCQIESNTDYAIRLRYGSFPQLSGNTYTSPNWPVVAIEEGGVGVSGTWYYNDIAGNYAVLGDVQVGASSDQVLTIAPGVTLHFGSGVQLRAGTSNYVRGSIRAVGTADSLITFTSLSGSVGDWRGIYLGGYSGTSSFERCLIEKGGQSGYNVFCNGAPSVQFATTQVRHSSTVGLQLTSTPASISRCDISDNGTAGVYVEGSTMPVMGGDPMHCNRLCENGTYDLQLQSSINLDASYNWWCSTDSALIADRIYDGNDGGGPGIVTFEPFSEEPCLENNPVEHFSLLSPGNGEMVATLTPTFYWEEAIDPDEADSVRYRLLISEDDLFTAPVVYDHLDETSYTVPVDLPDNTSFWWKVIAFDNALLETPSNETWTFTANVPPSIPEPIVPINGEEVGGEDWLVWFASEDPGGVEVTYHIQVDDSTSFESPEIDHTGLSLVLPLSGNKDGGSDQTGPVIRAISFEELSQLAPHIFPEGSVHSKKLGSDEGEAYAVRLGTLPGSGDLTISTTYYWRVQALDNHNAASGFSDGTAFFVFRVVSAVPIDEHIPSQVFLSRGTPNPFENTTLFAFGLPSSGPAAVQVFNAQGRLVRTLAEGTHMPGIHQATWDGRDDDGVRLPSGIYFGRLQAGGTVKTTKLVFMRQ